VSGTPGGGPSVRRATPESREPLEALLRLPTEDPEALARLVRGGDWRTRVLALSALGRAIRSDKTAFGPPLLKHRLAGRFPPLRRIVKSVGPRGVAVRAPLFNRVQDRVWLVRTAAALGLGECRDPELVDRLRPLLLDPYRPVRIAAAAALAASGNPERPELDGAEPAPAAIGDTESSREWLRALVRAHPGVLSLLALPGAPRDGDPDAWALFLMGEPRTPALDPRTAEIVRYAQEKEHHHNVTKPFTPGHREQNLQLLHAFLAVAENLQAPHGGRILDLGGGAAWVSDLLVKLGFRAFTLDIAEALLRVGRDRFTREHETALFTCGDMALLPFPDRSFDAVVVIDALHHCPDVPAVFREAHRVLMEGGQFLLAEPGEGHAESPRSRREDLEHSICEREIHLPEVVGYARSAGFTGVSVVPHFVPTVHMAPEAVEAAARTPSSEWRAERGGGKVALDEYLIQSTLGHPILVLSKGARALDSRVPGLLRAEVEADLVRSGAGVKGAVQIRNAGDTAWLRGGDERGRVRLGVQLLAPDHSLVNLDFARETLPEDVPPGGTLRLPVSLSLPSATEPYVLKLDMVDEHICWFEDAGSRPLYLSL
jgi:SAM-dependent methyltransferase